MATVQTATGAVDTSALGSTLMHEHVVIRSPGVFQAWPHLWDQAAEASRAVKTLTELKSAGVDTIVDLTTVDLGRDVRLVCEIAAQIELNVILCTGVWRFPPQLFRTLGPDALADLFVKDIEEGMEGGTTRAGIIKLATEPEVDEPNEAMLRAGARAHRRTGVPISTHHYVATRCGLDQQNVFESEGVDLSRVVIGHSGDTEDTDYLTEIIGRGSYIGMDRFGIERMLSTEKRTDTVAKLCEMGHAGKIVLSHDTNCFMDTIPSQLREQNMPNWHFLHITNDVLPALRAKGVTEDQITQMMVTNPREIFERQGTY